MIKDAIIALSLANLCFIVSWNELLAAPIRRFNTCLAIIINVILLASFFWIAMTLARRSRTQLAARVARLLFPLVLLLPLNGLLRILFPHIMPFNLLIVIGLGIAVMGLYEIMPWYPRIIRTAEVAVMVLFPFCVIAIAQASWSLKSTPRKSIVQPVIDGNPTGRRVLWLLFDEMDQHVAFSNRPATLNLPELDRLREQALYARNVYSPSDSTLVSVPALITGKILSNTEMVNQSKLMITFADADRSVDWGSQPNVFSRAREAGFNTTLIGWYLPCCNMIGESLTNCSWVDTEAVTLSESLSKQIQDVISTIPIASSFVFAHRLEANRTDERRRTLESYIETLQAAKAAIADPNFGLVLVHWPVPHPPGIYSRRKNAFETNDESSYLDNLKLVDQALGELRSCMEGAGTWDNTTVLVTSDHWWRTDIWRPTDSWTREDAETEKGDTDHRVPFLLKLAGQRTTVTYDPVFNNVLTQDLVDGLLRGDLTSPDSVAQWIDQHRSIGETPYRFNLPQ